VLCVFKILSHLFSVHPNAVVFVVCEGVAHGAYNNDIEALLGIRELVNYLPLSNREHAPIRKCDDPWLVLLCLSDFVTGALSVSLVPSQCHWYPVSVTGAQSVSLVLCQCH